MLNRVRFSLIYPQGLIQYHKDSIFKVLAYVLFFAFLMSTPLLINTLTYDGINVSTKDAIVEAYVPVDNDCSIVNAAVSCDQTDEHVFVDLYNAKYTLDLREDFDASIYDGLTYNLVLREESVYLIVMGNIVMERDIASMHPDVHNLDLTSDDPAFFDAVFNGVNQEITETKGLWGTALILSNTFFNFVLFNLFILINTVLTNTRLKGVTFKQLYVMMGYAATLLYIVLIFNEMLSAVMNVSFFILLIALFVAFRQMNKLSMALYMRRKR